MVGGHHDTISCINITVLGRLITTDLKNSFQSIFLGRLKVDTERACHARVLEM